MARGGHCTRRSGVAALIALVAGSVTALGLTGTVWGQSATQLPTGYWVDVDESGSTTSGNLGGSGSLAASGQGNVNYGYAQECAPSSDGGPFSIGHYPPLNCAQVGRAYATTGSPETPSGLWFTGNQHCVDAGRPFSGSVFTWHVTLPASGPWHVDASIPSWTSYGWGNQYVLSAGDGQAQSSITQQADHGQWVNLFADHQYTAGQDYTVTLTLADTADANCHYQMADQMRWVYDGAPSPPTPTTTTTSTGGATTLIPPAWERAPTITGSAIRGRLLTAHRGTWLESPTSFSYQWRRCDASGNRCVAIPGARATTYRLAAADVGHTLDVQESAQNAGGSGKPATSQATGTVLPALHANRRLHTRILAAAARLTRERGAPVRIAVTVTGAVARSIGLASGTTLTGTGAVDFADDRASWSLRLPAVLGGGSLRMIVTRSAAYVHLGQVASLSRRQWIRVRPGQLSELPRLGFVGSLAVLLNPREAVGLLASTSVDAAKLSGARAASDRVTEPVASAAAAGSCTPAPGITSVQSALDPGHLRAVGKQWAKTYRDALGTYKDVRMVSRLGFNGGIAAIGMIDQEGLTIWNDYCPADSGPTGVAAIPTSLGKLTDVKAWLTIDPCLVGTWSMVGPLENEPGHPIANGSTILTILPDGQGTLTFAEIKYPVPLYPGFSSLGMGSVTGTAALAVVAPVALSDIAHRLVWNVVASSVTDTFEGWIDHGSPGYFIEDPYGPPVYVPPVPDHVSPEFSLTLSPDVRQTSYDCNSEHGTLSLEMPFPGWKPFDVTFARTTEPYKPSRG